MMAWLWCREKRGHPKYDNILGADLQLEPQLHERLSSAQLQAVRQRAIELLRQWLSLQKVHISDYELRARP